jgi:outer membrane lipase/esterase
MRQTKFALAVLTAALLTACGGGTSPAGGDQATKVTFTNQVSFGDSLSDVGTYRVGAVAAAGGGKFTINGDSTAKSEDLNGKIWLDFMAAQLKLPAPCAAQTGLQGDASLGFSVPIVNNPNCFNYAQGGSRVVNPIGPGNAATGSPIGEMTTPMVTQIANHLARSGNKFTGTELVTVLSGGNDVPKPSLAPWPPALVPPPPTRKPPPRQSWPRSPPRMPVQARPMRRWSLPPCAPPLPSRAIRLSPHLLCTVRS